MTMPLHFDDASARFALPLLFPGQAQKEIFVNEAFARIDTLLHCAVEGEANAPSAAPGEGEAWLIAAPATGDWAGREGEIACRQGGGWVYVVPRDGMTIYDHGTGQALRHDGEWRRAGAVPEPTGGSTIDAEARAAIAAIVASLTQFGILSES